MTDANGNPQQSLQGFEPKFTDFVDYIIRITHELWEEKAIGKPYEYYANTVQIHTSDRTIYGREAVSAGTIATLAAYPDRRLYGDDTAGLYSSHRLVHAGTNRGWSLYGPPTHQKIEYYAVTDCFCIRNRVVEEWLVRDELTLVRQLGLEPVSTAQKMTRKDAEKRVGLPIDGDIERVIGQRPLSTIPASESFEPENFIRCAIHEAWNWRLLNRVREYFAETVYLHSASIRHITGYNDYQAYGLSLLSPFPDLAVIIEHFCVVGDTQSGYRTATRWRMKGTHTGFGIYGEPTGKRINILGISHHPIRNGKIQNEWTIFDEFVLLKQIHRPD